MFPLLYVTGGCVVASADLGGFVDSQCDSLGGWL